MSKAAELAALIGSQTALSNRNLIINGAMQVAQRGADNLNITTASGGTFAADRFKFFLSLGGTAQFDLQQVAEAPSGSGFTNSLKVSCDVTATLTANHYLFLAYNIEGQDLQHLKKGTDSAESVTLSFHLRSNKTSSGSVMLRDTNNNRMIGGTYTVSSANTWQKVTMTFAGDTVGAIDNDNLGGMRIEWHLDSGTTYSSGTVPTSWETRDNADRNATNFGLVSSTDNYWQITGVQLEIGEQATPFEHRPFGDELRRCQRYYETSFDSAPSTTNTSNNGLIASGGIAGDTTTSFSPEASATYKVSKRAVPTVTFYDLATGRNTGKCHRFQLGAQAHDNSAVTIADSGLTRFNAYSGSGNACSGIAFHYEADAEL